MVLEYLQLGLWEGFESTWPVITTPDKGAEYALAEKSMAWPGWGHALEWLPLMEYNSFA